MASTLLPFLEIEACQPYAMVAVYGPTWVVDAQVQGQPQNKNPGDVTEAMFRHAYLPGNELVYMRVGFTHSEQLTGAQPIVWDESLRFQRDMKVHCKPYTVSPVDFLTSPRPSQRTDNIDPSLPYRPHHVNVDFFAASPVLIPLYIIKYHSVVTKAPFFVTYAAHSGRAYVADSYANRRVGEMTRRLGLPVDTDILDVTSMLWTTAFLSDRLNEPVTVRDSGNGPKSVLREMAMFEWASELVTQPLQKGSAFLKDEAQMDAIMQDPRVRPYDLEERRQVESWLEALWGHLQSKGTSTLDKVEFMKQLVTSDQIKTYEDFTKLYAMMGQPPLSEADLKSLS
ncbi:hypothetical protein EWM64_g1896 [Hericium alpestre]|uniref:Uncharacterized protein n=1 Tax=Hericium alpestre TaxID=135208 RepID=A0A4Z0A4Z2_9AGAM|nr:hypothetical protein EWM64_g1896 [Hericium alpestre]